MNLSSSSVSCGVQQLSDLSRNQEDNIRYASQDVNYNGFSGAFLIFSDHAHALSNGSRLAAFIKKKKLGTVTATRSKVNPNSGNAIKVWVWAVDKKAVAKFK